jgi:hypothetical protein
MPLEVWKSLRISVGKVRFELLENIKSLEMRYVRILGYFRGFPDYPCSINIKHQVRFSCAASFSVPNL